VKYRHPGLTLCGLLCLLLTIVECIHHRYLAALFTAGCLLLQILPVMIREEP
jgi:hypothetical protein